MPLNLYIVDDDDAVRASLVRLLSGRAEYQVRCFASGTAFLESCEHIAPGVVLLDYYMRGVDGLEVLNTLRSLSRRFVVIMLTAHGAVQRSVDAMKAGAFDFIEKPFDPEVLLLSLDASFIELDHSLRQAAGREEAIAQLAMLSPREAEVMAGLATGRSNKQIAWDLKISPRTVEVYRASLMDKLKARSLSHVLKLVFLAEGRPAL